jgi:Calpain family cysteine protease
MLGGMQELSEGIFLYQTRVSGKDAAFAFEVEHTHVHHCLQLKADFTGSVNFALRGSSGLQAEVTAEPFTRTHVATLQLQDDSKRGIFRNACSWELVQPASPRILRNAAAEAAAQMEEVLQQASLLALAPEGSSSLAAVAQRCRLQGTQFIDTAFPATQTSLNAAFADTPVVWRRPCEFATQHSSFTLFAEPPRRADLREGLALQHSDAAFFCALAALAEQPAVLQSLLSADSSSSSSSSVVGLYAVTSYAGGMQRTLLLDDLFPCYAGAQGGPCVTRCHSSSLWALLLEKAAAKARGSYIAALTRQQPLSNAPLLPCEALIDLTGAPFWHTVLASQQGQSDAASGNLWRNLQTARSAGHLIVAATATASSNTAADTTATTAAESSDDNSSDTAATTDSSVSRRWNAQGLLVRYGYSLLDLREVGRVRAVQLRGPTQKSSGFTSSSSSSSNSSDNLAAGNDSAGKSSTADSWQAVLAAEESENQVSVDSF